MKRTQALVYILKDTIAVTSGIVACWVMVWAWLYFFDAELIAWNYWLWRMYFEYGMIALLGILFGLFVATLVYKVRYFRQFEENSLWSTQKSMFWWFIWSALSTIVVGCPACSITIASYLWLAWLIWFLPYDWIELKILGIGIMIWAVRKQLLTLHSCSKR